MVSHIHGADLFKINIVMMNFKNGGTRINSILFLGMIKIHKLNILMKKICLR